MIKDDLEIIKENVGNYIVLEGKGIMSGFNNISKMFAHKIINVEDEIINGVRCHAITLGLYRKKHRGILSEYNQDQDYKIITKKEFKKLPVY